MVIWHHSLGSICLLLCCYFSPIHPLPIFTTSLSCSFMACFTPSDKVLDVPFACAALCDYWNLICLSMAYILFNTDPTFVHVDFLQMWDKISWWWPPGQGKYTWLLCPCPDSFRLLQMITSMWLKQRMIFSLTAQLSLGPIFLVSSKGYVLDNILMIYSWTVRFVLGIMIGAPKQGAFPSPVILLETMQLKPFIYIVTLMFDWLLCCSTDCFVEESIYFLHIMLSFVALHSNVASTPRSLFHLCTEHYFSVNLSCASWSLYNSYHLLWLTVSCAYEFLQKSSCCKCLIPMILQFVQYWFWQYHWSWRTNKALLIQRCCLV